jgi:hypothetical protein
VQFAFVKVRDANSGLPKYVLISWCGDGVPERLKGYHSSHMASVSKVLSGYHINITARSEDDLDPERVIQRVADSSGAKYSFASSAAPVSTKSQSPAPQSDGLYPTSRPGRMSTASGDIIQELPITETHDLHRKNGNDSIPGAAAIDTVKGGYQPVGKVDIAAIRARSQNDRDDRPTPVKGVYEPIGKVDIAAIKAQAQRRDETSDTGTTPPLDTVSLMAQTPGRVLPHDQVIKPVKPVSKTFIGTKPPVPIPLGFGTSQASTAPVVGIAGRTFANERGKTPAQIWAEKRAKNDAHDKPISAPVANDSSTAQSQWKSGYKGKNWAPVQTASYGRSLAAESDASASTERIPEVDPSTGDTSNLTTLGQHDGGHEFSDKFSPPDEPITVVKSANSESHISGKHQEHQTNEDAPSRPVQQSQDSARRSDQTGDILLSGASAASDSTHVIELSNMPQRLAETDTGSIGHSALHQAATESPDMISSDTPATALSHPNTVDASHTPAAGNRARVRYDYDRAEDNEISLIVDDIITSLEMVDDDWWFGTNSQGERGLFPSNYVELLPHDKDTVDIVAPVVSDDATTSPQPLSGQQPRHATATALFDYEPAEDNGKSKGLTWYNMHLLTLWPELGFSEGAIISNLEFPDDDWWFGSFDGRSGLFPASYVHLET